jgi:hypothetical protein
MAIRVHCYENIQNDSKMMMIHDYRNGKLITSSSKMKYCEKTIRLWSRGHKSVEICNVAKSRDLQIRELIF